MNYLYGTETIIRYYKEFTGIDIESPRDIKICLFLAHGLYARKTGKKLLDMDFEQWTKSPNMCPSKGLSIDRIYGIFTLGYVFPLASEKYALTKGVELDCIKKSVEIFAKNKQMIRHLLSEDSKFLPWNCKTNLYNKIPFKQIHKFFKDNKNIQILAGEKAFVEPNTEIEK